MVLPGMRFKDFLELITAPLEEDHVFAVYVTKQRQIVFVKTAPDSPVAAALASESAGQTCVAHEAPVPAPAPVPVAANSLDELREWRRRHRNAVKRANEMERVVDELELALDDANMRAAMLEADSARLEANRETLLELGVRAKAQLLLREFSRQSVVASAGVTLSPEYAADMVALLQQLCACVTPAGDIALRGDSDAANAAEAAEDAARDAWEHAVDEAWEREAVEHEGFRPRRSSQ